MKFLIASLILLGPISLNASAKQSQDKIVSAKPVYEIFKIGSNQKCSRKLVNLVDNKDTRDVSANLNKKNNA